MPIDSMKLKLVNDISPYKIAGASGTPAVRRRAITELLSTRMVAINGTVINKARINAMLSSAGVSGAAPTVKIPFIHEGTVLVNGNGDTSDGSYPIVAHKSVCFDMQRGNGVTGVNPVWQQDQFYPVGVSLANLASGQKLVPIMLQPAPRFNISEDFAFALSGPLASGGNCAAAVQLIWNGTEFIAGEAISVCDYVYKTLIGEAGDTGYYQVHSDAEPPVNNIKTLTCRVA